MTVKPWMDLEDLQPERSYKELQKVEVEKEAFLSGQVEMEEETMTIVIVMATQIHHGHYP